MQIIIQGHGTSITPSLREYANKKLAKLEQFYANIIKIDAVLDARSIKDSDRSQVAEVNVQVAGKKILHASEAGRDMYAAIDLVIEELKRQLKKHKDMHVQEKRRKAEKEKEEAFAKTAVKKQNVYPTIVAARRFVDKPLRRAEAQDEINSLGHDFLAYSDADSKEITVAFKNPEGEINFVSASELGSPLTLDQAMETIEQKQQPFFVFKNRDTGMLNVIFKRKLGNYGLVEPEL